MARVPKEELEKLKREISIERLVEKRGVKLEPRGADLVGLCPFHTEATGSLVITPAKNLWHCFGCGAGGDVVAWVMKTEGVSFRHAVQLLREGASIGENTAKVGTVRKLAPPVSFDADDTALFGQVVAYYHRCLLEKSGKLEWLVLEQMLYSKKL